MLCRVRETAFRGERYGLVSLDSERICHTEGVKSEALYMAGVVFPALGIPKDCLKDVECMALLHDVTKQTPLEVQKELCKRHSVELTVHELESPQIIHAYSGACAAKEFYCMPERITNAVFKHTTGSGEMNIFDKLLFVADYTEPGRRYESCKTVRKVFHDRADGVRTDATLASELVDECVCLCAVLTCEHISKKGLAVHPDTTRTVYKICGKYKGTEYESLFDGFADRLINAGL